MTSEKKIVQAENIYFLLKENNSCKRLGKLFFLKDNTICFTFPKLSIPGILAESICPTDSNEIQKIDLKKKGKVTRETVKFSYHPNGRAHFSMNKRIYTTGIDTIAFLNTPNRHLFSCFYQNLDKFPNISNSAYNRYSKSGLVKINFDNTISSSFTLSFYTYSLENFNSSEYQKSSNVILLSPNGKISLKIIIPEPVKPSKGEPIDTIPIFVFTGGFKSEKTGIKFLSAMYPATKFDYLLKILGTVDIKN